MIQRRLLAPITAMALAVAVMTHAACGTSCPEIRRQRERFEARVRSSGPDLGPDALMALPFALLDRVIQGRLARRPPLNILLPIDKLGLEPSLSLTLERVTTHAAPPGRLGVTLHLGLLDRNGARVLELELDGAITPMFQAAPKPALALVLRPKDLGRVRPHTTPEGTRVLRRWLSDNVPPLARALLTEEVIDALAQESLDFIANDVWPHAKDRLLGDAPLFDTRLALPDLPIRELELTSSEHALVATITTDLPEAEPLSGGFDRTGERLSLRLSGGTAMGLVNRAMERGSVPARYDADGKPSRDGVWEARLGWRGGATPLVVHLWRTSGACKHAVVAARLGLALQGDTVRVQVHDGRLVSLDGPAFAEAFAWLERIFGDALSVSFDAASFVRFDAGDEQVQLRLARIVLGERDFILDLDLGVARR